MNLITVPVIVVYVQNEMICRKLSFEMVTLRYFCFEYIFKIDYKKNNFTLCK